ncbi:hypothetical protein [Sediminitomix flava]|uniref:Uncharacterized protein n=1 Tax=Sediminitomix flava TaxID=379075 RepID=A0A315ZZU2_SEDFL|nr:hypothetical protein [Sediminitomix flava]PWJ42897.1 hypothetical protein BC781_102443 [Sediminitomix flava]
MLRILSVILLFFSISFGYAQDSPPIAMNTSEPVYLEFGMNEVPLLALLPVKDEVDQTKRWSARGFSKHDVKKDANGVEYKIFHSKNVRVSGTASDDANVEKLKVFIGDKSIKVNVDSDTTISFYDYVPLEEGFNDIIVKAVDAGNLSTEGDTIRIAYVPLMKGEEKMYLSPTFKSLLYNAAMDYCEKLDKYMSGNRNALAGMFKIFENGDGSLVYDDADFVPREDQISLSRYMLKIKNGGVVMTFPKEEDFAYFPIWGVKVENGKIVKEFTEIEEVEEVEEIEVAEAGISDENAEGGLEAAVEEKPKEEIKQEEMGIIRIIKGIEDELMGDVQEVKNYIVINKRGNIVNILKELPEEARELED